MTEPEQITFRTAEKSSDIKAVRLITESSGFFNPGEVEVAVELIEDRLKKGKKSEYNFLFADLKGIARGFTCWGPIACTKQSYDLYWIAVLDEFRGRHIGKKLLAFSEQKILESGGRRIYVETSSRAQYRATRAFYLRNGYTIEAELMDFYDTGDNKVIFVKVLEKNNK
jgi:ribosomal protein S18 acetylase RimI-like enzyme